MKLKLTGMRHQGFTIVELIVVIVVLAILATLVVISYENISRESDESSVKTDLRHAYAKLKTYRLDNGEYPMRMEGDSAVASNNTVFSYIYGGSSQFCLTGQSAQAEDITFHINEDEEVLEGPCGPMTGTPEVCFAYTLSGGVATITNYTETNPLCPTDVVIPDQLYGAVVGSIQQESFRSKGLTSVVIPQSTTSIGQFAFDGNLLSRVTIREPSTLASISSNSFQSQGGNLKKIVIPESVTYIGNNAFSGNVGIICSFYVGKSFSNTGCSQIRYVN